MEGRGGHTKECKVRTTTSANPLLAAACPHSAPHPSWQPPPPPPSPPPIASSSFFTVSSSSAGGYNALSYKAVLSSPSLNCFPTPPVLRFLSPPPPSRIPIHLAKESCLPLPWTQPRHSSLIHEWSLVRRRIPRLRARSSATVFRHQRRGTLCWNTIARSKV